MSSFEKVPIAEIAKFLGTSRDTAKRLFQRNVLPEEWLEFSPGGKWFVLLDQGRRQEARHRYDRYQLLRRKPSANRSELVKGSLSDDSVALLSHGVHGEDLDEELYEKLVKALFGEGPECKGDPETLRQYAALQSALSNGGQQDQHDPALWLLLIRLLEFRERFGHEASPTSKDWAEMLHCSVASIYRHPFGKDRLKRALTLAALLDPTRSSESPYSTSASDRTEYLEDGFRFGSRKEEPKSRDAVAKDRKRLRDSSRREREKEMHFVWEMRRFPDRSLHLYLVPTLEAETIARYEEKDSKVTDKQFQRAESQIGLRKRQVGCIIEQGHLVECRFFIDSHRRKRPNDSRHDIPERAVTRLLRLAEQVRHPTFSLHGDWKRLKTEGLEKWKDPPQ